MAAGLWEWTQVFGLGVVDTGIWPESQRFNDSGLPPVPDPWKSGRINERKLYKSRRDEDGHGTHTTATVAGAPVRGANLLGYIQDTARAMAPGARVAAYKVCWDARCLISDVIAAIDQAVTNGVNVLSISLALSTSSYQTDSLSIATFGALEKGVFISLEK
ncbi:hypothetical protein AgCh_037075 [Apium graveolens]